MTTHEYVRSMHEINRALDDARQPTRRHDEPMPKELQLPVPPMEPKQSWLIEWSSATGRGSYRVAYPEKMTRLQVWKVWESANHGCYVERLTSRGGAV